MTRHSPRGGRTEVRLVGGLVQPDLFGETDAALAWRVEAGRVRAEVVSRARVMPDGSPVFWTAPYQTARARAGERVPGWRCWLCGVVEANEFVLVLRHGLDAADPGVLERTSCRAQDQARGRARDAGGAGGAGGPR